MREGRLTGVERVSFERHLAQCGACSREAEWLATLGDALRASHPASADELRVRRERTRLLAAFDDALTTERSPTRAWRRVGVLAAAASLGLGLFLFWIVRPAVPPVFVSHVSVDPEAGANWVQGIEHQRRFVRLEDGKLRIRVAKRPGERPLLVILPDGELEDVGTIFTVEVEARRTTRVEVEEGGEATSEVRGGRSSPSQRESTGLSRRPHRAARYAPSRTHPSGRARPRRRRVFLLHPAVRRRPPPATWLTARACRRRPPQSSERR